MRDILDPISKWWDAGETFGLATVVRTFSSAPREPGAAMAVSADGEAVGSVSGGCVEGAVYELAGEVRATGQPVLQTYGISDDDAFAVGLTCGGIIDIFVEPVEPGAFPELGEVAAAVRADEPVAVATVIDGPGRVGARRVIWGQRRAGPATARTDPAGDGHRRTAAVIGHARLRRPAGPGGGRRRARDARAGPDRGPPVRPGRRAAAGRAVGVRPVVRAAAADAGLRRDRLRRRGGPGGQVPRLPGDRLRRPAGVRDPRRASPTRTRW